MPGGELTLDSRVAWAVHEEDYARLLGYPHGVPLEGEPRELAQSARAWVERHTVPRVFVSHWKNVRAVPKGVTVSPGRTLVSAVLSRRFQKERATRAAAVAVSAGKELDAEVERLWPGHPAEAYFLDRLGAALVEHLSSWTREVLSAEAETAGRSVCVQYSPGYRGWKLEEQSKLMDWLVEDAGPAFAPHITLHPSAMLSPRHSLLAVWGMGPASRRGVLDSVEPCAVCSLRSCAYRRRAAKGVPAG